MSIRQGGSYVSDGKGPARLVARTEEHAEGNRPRAADGTPLAKPQQVAPPAKAASKPAAKKKEG